jgi:hypothetical protein
MTRDETAAVTRRLAELLREHYVFPEVVAQIAARLAARDYGEMDGTGLAAAITTDLQSVNGDLHLRLIHHESPLPESFGQPESDIADFTAWSDRTAGGLARVERLAGNVGHLEFRPLIFPAVIAGDRIAAAMTLLSGVDALIIDLRGCLGGAPDGVAMVASYLFDHEPIQLSGLYERKTDEVHQTWTAAYLPGRRLGPTPPVYALTSATTFSGGEALAYDLQQHGRATVVGERTGGGAYPREAFRVHPHLEVTIPVARPIHPVSGTNWEAVGVAPDVEVPADYALSTAYRLALGHVVDLGADGRRAEVHREAVAALG